mgnify:CR=1 FL=1
MSRDIASAHAPFKRAVFAVAMQISGVDIISRVGDINVSAKRIYAYTIRDFDVFLRAIGDEIVGHFFVTYSVDNAKGDFLCHLGIAP